MRYLLVTITLALLVTTAHTQSLCLQKDAPTNPINFQPEELNRFLHLDKYKVVFFGEQHNAEFDPEIKYHLITDLYKRSGIRHVFMETSVSRAWRYNLYLKTGDTTDMFGSGVARAYAGYTLFWKRLYAFNKTLPDTAKIIIHGGDFETTAVFPTLKQLAPDGQAVPAALQPVMDTINAHLADSPLHMWDIIDNKFILYDNSAFTKTLRYVQAQLLDHDADVKAWFGDNYSVVHNIATNTSAVEVKPSRRNKTIFAAIKRAVEEEHIDKFIGFFGGMHTNNSIHNSLPNAVKKLKDISSSDILTIAEFAYDTKSKITAFRRKHYQELVDRNKGCRASVHPANAVPEFGNECDFVVLVDIGE